MVVNVTQKDKTLRTVMRFCESRKQGLSNTEYCIGYKAALNRVIIFCDELLGYSGDMPLEVPNQSETEDEDDEE